MKSRIDYSEDIISALDGIYDQYAGRIYHYVLTMVGLQTDAEDVLQGLFLKLMRMGDKMRQIEDIKNYLLVSARNEALRLIGKKKSLRQVKEDYAKIALVEAGPDTSIEEAAAVNHALKHLPVEQREVVMLKVYQELSFKEIGELIGVSLDTAASRYRYAMDKLKAELKTTHRGDAESAEVYRN